MNWQEEVAKEMKQWGFRRGKYNPCLYWNPTTYLLTLVHGDDFVSTGSRGAALDFKKKLETRLEIKSQVVGPGPRSLRTCPGESVLLDPEFQKEAPEGRALNRVIRCTDNGWEVEPDQRHVDLIVQEIGMKDVKPVSPPG